MDVVVRAQDLEVWHMFIQADAAGTIGWTFVICLEILNTCQGS